jgi:hypothetical protein
MVPIISAKLTEPVYPPPISPLSESTTSAIRGPLTLTSSVRR